MLQVTAWLALFDTVAVNCCVCNSTSPMLGGLIETLTGGTSEMVADAVRLALDTLVAVTVTV
jgi:hypothetical protein